MSFLPSKKRNIETQGFDGKEQQSEKIINNDQEQEQQEQEQLDKLVESRRNIWKERRALERFRVDSLIELKDEAKRNEMKKKEVELLVADHDFGGEDQIDEHGKQVLEEFEMAQQEENIVKLNVRGKIFVTTKSTLCKRENMLKVMLESQFDIDRDENGCILIDRDPEYFPIILEHIRTGSTTHIGIWEEARKKNIKRLKKLLEESDFFTTEKLTNKLKSLIESYKAEVKENKRNPVISEEDPESRYNVDEIMDEEFYSKFAMITLEEKEIVEKYIKDQKEKLQKEFDDLKETEMSKNATDIGFNVRGVKFSLSKVKLLREPDSLFFTIVKNYSKLNSEIFIDRDPEIFKYIYEYLLNGKIDYFPTKTEIQKQIYSEAKYFRLKGLILEYFDICRYPIEEIGEKNLKFKRYEDFLRNLFVVDRENVILNDPYLNLINIFGSSNSIRKSFRSKQPVLEPSKLLFNFEDPFEAFELAKKSSLVIPVPPELVDSREDFLQQFEIFTDGIFKGMDWSNLFVAGGSVLASCLKIKERPNNIFSKDKLKNTHQWKQQNSLSKLWGRDDASDEEVSATESTEEIDEYVTDEECDLGVLRFMPSMPLSKEELIREYFNNKPWRKSDIDCFIYGLSETEAEKKIVTIFETFKKNCQGGEVLILRTQHAITFKFSGFHKKSVQIILRIYKSPSEILSGFDIPCCCIGFDGDQVFCLPRAREAIRTRCNIVDVDRQSTTFETRLIKYALRGFRIGVCGYDIKKVVNPFLVGEDHPTISQFNGLARILIIMNSFKKRHEFDALTHLRGKRTLESTERHLELTEPSKNHDYSQVDITFSYGNVSEGFAKIDRRVKYITNNLKMKTFFEFALNDIQAILRPKKMNSDLSPQIEFIQIDPGQQHVGCFNPTSNNFLEQAYSPFKQKKLSKYTVKVYNMGKVVLSLDSKTSAILIRKKRQQQRRTYFSSCPQLKIGDMQCVANFVDSSLYQYDKNNYRHNYQGSRIGLMEFVKLGACKYGDFKESSSSSNPLADKSNFDTSSEESD